MTEGKQDKLIRQYAAGEITWHTLRERGFDNYLQVLGALGKLGLRPPVAPMDGPNVEARQHGRALLRQALKEPKP
ncbi:MAG: hypothetical protein L0Y57_15220 [Beijerinckiaceae bacterium]|nr:hypothetical protein [Beijerinckiaceae bacterium]